MTYEEAVKYILSIPKFTKKNKQEHTCRFLEYLGNPQKGRRIIHVAGTNGKGSVCFYLSTMLLAQKKTVGLFISPHLIKMNERIIINGRQISDDTFLELFEYVLGRIEKMQEAGLLHPTFFEFLFGMAMTAFAREDVEYIVLETGLGGRLDATNSIETPLVTAITSIGLDHTEILGDTIEKIAFEKAGIIKPGIPVFYSDTCKESNRVIENQAALQGAPCKKIGKDAYEILGIRDKHIAFSCTNAYYGNTAWTLNNIGTYQPGNALLAMEVMRFIFGNTGRADGWREALSQAKWSGRMEEILPGVYVDGAHNVSAVENFIKSVQTQKEENIILFSAVRDKNYEEMISCLCRGLNTGFYVLTRIENKRGTSLEELRHVFSRYTDKSVVIKESAREALQYVLKRQGNRKIYCLGSLYLVGELELIRKQGI
ncbi:bifunctional folylpolyglutamate synthase/dihydrofolate synthase [Clostridium sp. C105KSO13]|uniref:bifunctional folylpolyglutamate synthase/dihydrofolate synthase n=1 Tax=Clostridium sp. C105KSO13 TaxID=1776045 RepID=UPI00074078A0|nr:Mur ligase family protein [Clostridium sp. C105KSO13]CUX35923.1 Folylpolyglutamate synthase [Clostridium sp. C105KSO13]